MRTSTSPIDDRPLQIHVDPNVKPHAVHTPIPVPAHWRADVKAAIYKVAGLVKDTSKDFDGGMLGVKILVQDPLGKKWHI